MEIAIITILFAYLIVASVGVFTGFDLRKWPSWLYGAYGFLSGYLIGFLIVDVSSGLLGGVLFAFMILYGGAMTHFHRQRFK
jgi:hypothetical protein